MKNLKLRHIIVQALIVLIAVSCSESNKVVDQITDNVTRGAVLRQLEVFSNSVAINSATNVLEDGEQFSVLLEYQDQEDGSLLSTMDVYVAFNDNTDDNGDNTKSEILLETIEASAFSAGDRGFPQYTYTVSATAMQNALSLANDGIGFGGDQFTIRFALNLTDGRTFSAENNSGTITGSYFASPFLNRITVVCAPSVPTAGTWTFVTNDSYGDGWNGASLSVVIDGGDIQSISNVDGGPNEQIFTLEVPEGTQTISIKYVSGAWDEEVTFTVTSANGNDVAVAGPNPPAGSELLDYCLDNL
jgi:hypothetical protein